MAEDQEKQESSDSESPAGPMYFVHNASRSRHNRSLRAAAASHQGLKQYIGGQHRLIRGRPVALTAEKFQEYLPELKEKHAAGLIHVKTADGKFIDLETLEPVAGIPSPPLPKFRPDSAADDKNEGVGEVIPPYVGDDQSSMPAVLPPGQLPQVLAKKAEEEKAAAEADENPLEGLDADDTESVEKAIAEAGDATRDTEVVSSGGKGGKSRRSK